MAGTIITSEELARHRAAPDLVRSGSFSPGVKAGPFVYVSGTGARDLGKGIEGQSTQIFEYISKVLAEVGYSLSDVVKVQTFIKRDEDYTEYNEVRRRYFPQNPPASTTVVTNLVLPGMLVEVEAVAYKEQ